MTIMRVHEKTKEASTDTSGGLLTTMGPADDEMYRYIQCTERLLICQGHEIESNAGGDEIRKLSMKRSLFPHVPPCIIFQDHDDESTRLPEAIRRHLIWWTSGRTSAQMIKKTILKTGYTMTRKATDNWSGRWGATLPARQMKELKPFQRTNHFPGASHLGNKAQLWQNYHKMMVKFGRRRFDFVPLTFVLPYEEVRFRRVLQKYGGAWITKPPASCAGQGINVVTRWNEVPKNRSLVAQEYLTKPRLINGLKFDLRLYVLMTTLDPLQLYLYPEGLVRFATSKYVDDASFLFDRYMHLTNTSVNKTSPRFRSNNGDPCRGSMWSLEGLWWYLGIREQVDVSKIWEKIKDIAIKTVIAAEDPMVRAARSTLPSAFNSYQLFGFDVILNQEFKPWLLEVNNYPSMDPDTPLCSLVKGQLAKDFLNLVGFHLPKISDDGVVVKHLGHGPICHDQRLYDADLSRAEMEKQKRFTTSTREDYLGRILEDLTPDDVRVLIRYEDEIRRAGRFERIFPTSETSPYLRYFEVPRYYNLLLDAWEQSYGAQRGKGIERLQLLCEKKFHLGGSVNKPKQRGDPIARTGNDN